MLDFPCLAEPPGGSEAVVHQAVISQRGGPDESQAGNTACCQKEQGEREKQYCLHHHAHKVGVEDYSTMLTRQV